MQRTEFSAKRLKSLLEKACVGERFFLSRVEGSDPYIIIQHSWQDVAKISCFEEQAPPLAMFDYVKLQSLGQGEVEVAAIKEAWHKLVDQAKPGSQTMWRP
eukprot:11621701-Karenia_brevis.AAC.1